MKLANDLLERCNAIFDDCSELQQTRLDLSQGKAWITIGLHPEERGLDREASWRRLALSGLSHVSIWAGDETLPPELSSPGSPALLEFLSSLFRNQWIYQWDLLEPQSLPKTTANWAWQTEKSDFQAENQLGLFWERPGDQKDWFLGLSFSKLNILTPLETEQTLEEFVQAWGFLADA